MRTFLGQLFGRQLPQPAAAAAAHIKMVRVSGASLDLSPIAVAPAATPVPEVPIAAAPVVAPAVALAAATLEVVPAVATLEVVPVVPARRSGSPGRRRDSRGRARGGSCRGARRRSRSPDRRHDSRGRARGARRSGSPGRRRDSRGRARGGSSGRSRGGSCRGARRRDSRGRARGGGDQCDSAPITDATPPHPGARVDRPPCPVQANALYPAVKTATPAVAVVPPKSPSPPDFPRARAPPPLVRAKIVRRVHPACPTP